MYTFDCSWINYVDGKVFLVEIPIYITLYSTDFDDILVGFYTEGSSGRRRVIQALSALYHTTFLLWVNLPNSYAVP